MRVVLKEPGKAPEIREIENELHAMQEVVGGFIETVRMTADCIIVCNEMGRILELDPNTFGICGAFFICGDAGEEFRGLTRKEADEVMKMIRGRERHEKVTA